MSIDIYVYLSVYRSPGYSSVATLIPETGSLERGAKKPNPSTWVDISAYLPGLAPAQ